MRDLRCETCRFWDRLNGPGWTVAEYEESFRHPAGKCCRMPPTGIYVQGYGDEAVWPPTWSDDWCGEWQAVAPPLQSASPGTTSEST